MKSNCAGLSTGRSPGFAGESEPSKAGSRVTVVQRHHDVEFLDRNLHYACAESGRVRLDVWVGPLRVDSLHSDVQRHAARPILDVIKQHPAHRWTGSDGIQGHWIEECSCDHGAAHELACERDEDQRKIAGSESIAMALLAAYHPPLRVQEPLGPLPVAFSEVEDEVLHLRRGAR